MARRVLGICGQMPEAHRRVARARSTGFGQRMCCGLPSLPARDATRATRCRCGCAEGAGEAAILGKVPAVQGPRLGTSLHALSANPRERKVTPMFVVRPRLALNP